MKKVLLLCILGIIILSGCTTDFEVLPQESNADCGTSYSLASGNPLNEINFEKDEALVCLGKKIINDCEEGTAVLETSDTGKISYEIKGTEGENCILKLEYGDADQIPLEEQKQHANKYLECPVNLKELLEKSGEDASNKPGTLSGGLYMLMGFSVLDPNTKCYGTLLESLEETNVQNNESVCDPNKLKFALLTQIDRLDTQKTDEAKAKQIDDYIFEPNTIGNLYSDGFYITNNHESKEISISKIDATVSFTKLGEEGKITADKRQINFIFEPDADYTLNDKGNYESKNFFFRLIESTNYPINIEIIDFEGIDEAIKQADNYSKKRLNFGEVTTKDNFLLNIKINDLECEAKNIIEEETITPNLCDGITCNDYCDGTTKRYSGYCSEGQCIYRNLENDSISCGYEESDACDGVNCNSPYCDGTTLKSDGYCSNGNCIYESEYNSRHCGYQESETDPCDGVTCNSYCDGTTKKYNGYCSNGSCNYQTQNNSVQCGYQEPETDPCDGITCNDYCSNTTRVYNGSCSNGQCLYDYQVNSPECGYVEDPCDGVYCGSYEQCVEGKCALKTCDDIGGEICSEGELCSNATTSSDGICCVSGCKSNWCYRFTTDDSLWDDCVNSGYSAPECLGSYSGLSFCTTDLENKKVCFGGPYPISGQYDQLTACLDTCSSGNCIT